jgi:ribosomal protein S18 acetylase RimI-like enzyme
MRDVAVRPVREEEWAAFREIRLASLKTDPGAFGSTYEDEADRSEAEWRERTADREGRLTFVAEVGERWVGTATAAPWDGLEDVLGLFGMWVEPAWRRRGVGQLLVRSVLSFARERGVPTVQLLVAEGADAAQHLYAGCGFLDTGERTPIRDMPGAWIGVIMRRSP